MKSIKDILESSEESKLVGQMWSKRKPDLDKILRSTGWPKSEFHKGEMKSIDEDTIITFGLEEDYDWEPYIKDVKCHFYGPSQNTLRELNGLIDLYNKIHDYNWENNV